MRRVLYAFDKYIYEDFPDRNERIVIGHENMEDILKPNGTKIPLGFFVKSEMKEIIEHRKNNATEPHRFSLCL